MTKRPDNLPRQGSPDKYGSGRRAVPLPPVRQPAKEPKDDGGKK